jgi:lysophospholipase L1-like esterase
LQPNEVITAGFLATSGGIVRYAATPSGVIDYIPLSNTLPSSVPNPFTANASTSLDRVLKYNLGFRIRTAPFKVACIGDSITAGVGASSTATNYVSQLGKLLGSSYTVINYGVSSRTMLKHGNYPYWEEDGLHSGKGSAFRDSQALLPDVVIIMLGTNDSKNNPAPGQVNNWQYKSEFEPNYIEMINVYRSLSSHPMIYVNTCPTVSGTGAFNITNPIVTGEVVPLVRDAAAATGAWVADVNAATAYVPLDFPDNVHPNDAGHLVLANTVYSRMTAPQTILSGDTFKIIGKYSGKPIEVAGSSTADGAGVDQSADVSATNQKWVLTALSGFNFKIVNANSGKALDVAGGSAASGASIVQSVFTGALSQQWILRDLGRGYYRLENQNSHCVLDVTGASLADGALLQQATSATNAEQQSFMLIKQ